MKQQPRNTATEEVVERQNPALQRNYHCGRCQKLRMTHAEYVEHQESTHDPKKNAEPSV